MTEIVREGYTVELDAPEVYVDNASRGRSGHMTHAMAEFAPGRFIDFNSNCSEVRWGGHSPYGWVEYRISTDAGKSYGPVHELPYAKKCFLDGVYMISVEKAVACDDGSIVAFCLRNDGTDPTCCEPWNTCTVVRSTDGGESWSEAAEFCPYKGRIYDAVYHDGCIYTLIFCYEHFIGRTNDHVFRLYKSTDSGRSFAELCVIPVEGIGRSYGTILFDDAGRLHFYAYNSTNECYPDHAFSDDCGENWTVGEPCYLPQGIRNPQSAQVDGIYILHGRSTTKRGFVLYTSTDGFTWDEGTRIGEWEGGCYYSNNLKLQDEQGSFLLLQYSETYCAEHLSRVNVMHRRLRIRK